MKVYQVTITETLKNVVSVDAHNSEEAREAVEREYNKGEIILDETHFCHLDISQAVEEGQETEETSAMTRDDFMQFFRDDEKLNELSADDRIEVFSHILLGSSDVTKELFDSIINNFGVGNLEVIDHNERN